MIGSKARYVFDSSVIVSAMLMPGSVPQRAFERALHLGTILVSDLLEAELARVLRRRKFDRYLSEMDRLRFLAAFARRAELVEITRTVTICRDSKDNHILELAVSGRANCVVSGDRDLTVTQSVPGYCHINAT